MLAFVFIVNNPATAGDGKWTTNGPFGGRVFSIEIDPVNNNIIFAGTSNGIFRSTDAGLHWQLSFAAGHAIPSISIYKRNPNIIYAAGGSRVYRSVDGGRSWTIVKNPEVIESPYGTLSNNWMQTAVAVFPNSSSYLYAVDPDGFYFSRDGGDNWANIASSEVLQGGSAPLLVDPNDPNVVYVGGKGFKKTISGDTNWVQMKPAIGNAARINVLKMNPKNPNTLYAIVDNVLPWEPIDPGPGLFRSYDAGSTWIRIDSTLIIGNQDTYNVLAIDPVDTNIIYTAVPINMGTKATILKSIDGGAHWDTLYNYSDEYHVGVNAFAVHPVNNSVVYAGLIQDGMLKTTDGGSTWNVSGYGILGPSHPVLTLHPDQPGTIYVGSMGGYEHGGVFKSMDEGKSWVVINNGLTSTDVRAFAINPDDPNIMFAGTRWGLFMSADGGANWFRNSGIPESEFVQNLIIDPINSSVMYVTNGTDGGTAVWKTEDGGLTWTKIAKVGSGSDGMIIDLEFDPNNSTILYAANQRFTGTSQFGAISKSTDAGVTWTKLKRQGAEKIVAAPSNSQIIFFGTPDKGIYKSVDGGVTWVQKNSGIKSGLFGISVNDIVIDPINSSIIYAGLTNGIYKSVDGGDSWEPFPTDGLYWTDAWIQDITLDARTSTLYASVDNGGVYSYSLNPTIATSSIANIIDIPNDQGKQVRLTFKASANDKAGSERPVVQYGVWRRIEPGSLSNGAASIVNSTSEIFSGDISSKIGKSFYVVNQNKTSAGSEAENIFMDTKSSIHRFNENRERISLYDIATGKSSVRDFNYNINGLSTIAGETTPSIQSNSVLIGYEAVGVVPAIQSENYSFVSPTFIDSTTSSGINYSTFIITAHTQYPLIWSVSLPDSGYSVDNLAPTSPGNLNGIVQNGYALLNWQHVPDYNDFSNFAVYRDTVINFVPDAQKKLGKSVAPIYVDSTSEAGVHYYYKVSALDYAGNESRYSNEIALVVTGVKDEENKIPETFGLSQNYPNPFNPATVISYQLPINSLVTIKIFDVLGKEVVELVNEEKPAGRYEVKFSAKGGSASGGEASSLSSGVYLYRIQAGEFVQTRKMILTK
jgi:photosystem II stability/assembly factor-like uncharacterized protein